MRYNIAFEEEQPVSVTAFHRGQTLVANAEHPNFARILKATGTGTKKIAQDKASVDKFLVLFDVGTSIAASFKDSKFSRRVKFTKGELVLDGKPVHNALSETIISFYVEGNNDFKPLTKFMEKLSKNPNQHSIDHLFRWMERWHFGLAPDGDIIAYKGISTDGKSQHAGGAYVNGKWVDGRVPNEPHTVISMDREQVTFDPSHGCAAGLHVGNWSYARGFDKRWVRVKINPSDVVSVPSDSMDQKMRVCRYQVLDVVKAEDSGVLFIDAAVKKMARLDTSKEEGKRAASAAKVAAKANVPRSRDGFPVYYEQFTADEYNEACTVAELREIARTWEIAGASRMAKPALIAALIAEQPDRLASWPADDPALPENRG